ncbi:MAG: hypothetical protein ACRDHF_10520, partial [Tepidiformaceae bacterium]
MEIAIALGTFFTVTLALYGLLYKPAASGAMDARLGGLRYTRGKETLPDPEAAFTARVWRPLVDGVSRKAN